MAIRTARLTLLAFPQSWDGGSLVVRFLCLPKGDPEAAPAAGAPPFSTANLIFTARLIGSLDELPLTASSVAVGPLELERPPLGKAALFTTLASRFRIVAPGAARPKPEFRKSLTKSYEAITGTRQRSPYLSDAADYQCALHEGADPAPPPAEPPPDTVTWGRLISFALRQPVLATALGLMCEAVVPLPADSPDLFAKGGWLFIDLAPASDYAGAAGLVAKYAARIPPLAGPRSLFSALLFPVADEGVTPVADDAFREAERYDNGMARLVHGSQSDAGDSIQLAWDDEQIAEWFNRQIDRDGAGNLPSDAPLGVAGYRVDVRRQGDRDWNSLVRVESRGDLSLGPHQLGPFAGESIVEAIPIQVSKRRLSEYWLPSYLCSWRGSSLVLIDEDYRRLHEHPDLQTPEAAPHLLNRDQAFRPVGDKAVPLEYGATYEFRVRLADLTRGGPASTEPEPDPPGHSVTTIPFRRRKAPGRIQILERPSADERRVTIAKPRLGYPELLFAGVPFAALEADLAARAADPDPEGKKAREISAPDPDVRAVEIRVDVRTLDGDAALFLPLYTTTRRFDGDDDLSIDLEFEDRAVLAAFSGDQPEDGPLVLPTARGIRLAFTAIGRETPDYFASDAARRGEPVPLECRADAIAEDQDTLLSDPDGIPAVRSYYFQPPTDDPSIPHPVDRLAQDAALDHTGLQLSGRSGHRTVIGCSAALRHALSPDSSSIQIASGADLIHRWINIVQLRLQRDWTWDGLDEAGIAVTRTIQRPGLADVVELAGVVRLPHAVGPKAVSGAPTDVRAEARQWTDLLFFDAFDPKPAVLPPPAGPPPAEPQPGEHPSEITVRYELTAPLKGPGPISVEPAAIRLPVTTPPWQVPRLVSAGIALSPYESAADYSSTQSRRRMLWLEFAEAPIDPDDAYFVRVLAMAPDPMLASGPASDVVEPPLPIDQEWMRLITPGQPRDDSGLRAMQRIASPPASPRYSLVPLPDGLNEASLELFGFFVYEVRVGHTESRWCTAQGRFGPALRVAGVQHPAPPLVCQAARGKTAVLVRAPYATPVHEGRSVRPVLPQTQMWGLLYARARQADATAWRNVLLRRVQLSAPRLGNDPEGAGARVLFAEGLFPLDEVRRELAQLGLPGDAPLTALATELFTEPAEEDPLGAGLGNGRLLRVSPLVPVPDAC